MSVFKRELFDQFKDCPSKELSATARHVKQTLPSMSTLTVIMEYIVCCIMLKGCYAWRSMTLEKVQYELSSRSYGAFKKLCEVSYRRQQTDGQGDMCQDIPYALFQAAQKEKRLIPFFDIRTVCDIYPPAPMTNLFLPASTELECFLSAIHLLDQPADVIKSFVESVLRMGTNERVLVYLVGLASKHKGSDAFKALPDLLQYMWHEVTEHDAATVSWRLKVVIRCYCEAKRSSVLSAFRSNSRGYHFKRIQSSFSPLGCFLSSPRGQLIVESYIIGYIRGPCIRNTTNKTLRVSKYWRLPRHTRSHIIPQTIAIQDHAQDMSEDMHGLGTIVMPSCPALPITEASTCINDHDLDDEGDWSQVPSVRSRNTRDQRSKDVLCCNQSVFYGFSSRGVYRLTHSSTTENQAPSAGEVELPPIDNPILVTIRFIIPERMYPVLANAQQIPSNFRTMYNSQ